MTSDEALNTLTAIIIAGGPKSPVEQRLALNTLNNLRSLIQRLSSIEQNNVDLQVEVQSLEDLQEEITKLKTELRATKAKNTRLEKRLEKTKE